MKEKSKTIVIAVGSYNPVKLEATLRAFKSVWPEKRFKIVGTKVKSGVSNQPMSDKKSITGARNRARNAILAGKADFGVGLEGGLAKIGEWWFDCGWIVVVDKKGLEGIGSTIKLPTPAKMVKMIKRGMELGEVNDKLFGLKNSKQGQGHFGLMTKGSITRTDGYRDGVIAALVRFIQPAVFE